MTNYEDLIFSMLDEIELYKSNTSGRCSKYSIIEKYFKKIREETKKDCIELCNAGRTETELKYPAVPWIIEEIEKL